MIITEKMIRELQRRVDISYEDAERFLRRAGGNIDSAEAFARKRANSLGNRLFREFEKIINASLIYRIKIYKNDDQFINVPILSIIIILIIIGVNKTLLLGVVFVIFALIADCNLQITKIDNQEEFRFYKTVNKDEVRREQEAKADGTETELESIQLKEQMNQKPINEVIAREKGKAEDKEEFIDPNEDDYYEVTIDK